MRRFSRRKMSANDEMRAIYGTLPDKSCRFCDYCVDSFCALTNGKLKCSKYAPACTKFVSTDKNIYR